MLTNNIHVSQIHSNCTNKRKRPIHKERENRFNVKCKMKNNNQIQLFCKSSRRLNELREEEKSNLDESNSLCNSFNIKLDFGIEIKKINLIVWSRSLAHQIADRLSDQQSPNPYSDWPKSHHTCVIPFCIAKHKYHAGVE